MEVKAPGLAPTNQDSGRSSAQLEQYLLVEGAVSLLVESEVDIVTVKARSGQPDKHDVALLYVINLELHQLEEATGGDSRAKT